MKQKPSVPQSLKHDILKLDLHELRKAIVLKEILGPPKVLEKRHK